MLELEERVLKLEGALSKATKKYGKTGEAGIASVVLPYGEQLLLACTLGGR